MNEKEALNYAMKLCSKKEYSSGEIFKKLIDLELPEATCVKVVNELKAEKFIDDSRFAQAFVNDKLKFSKWGKIKIAFMLRQKEVSDIIINTTLSTIDKELYESILLTELKKKSKSIKANNDYELKGKLIQFASGRGFEYEIASRVVNKLVNS
jgi:regulatory protein